MTRVWLALAICSVVLAGPVVAQDAPFDPAAWQQDVRIIGRELPARHPNLFYRITRAQWDSAVAATERRMPSLTRDQALVALIELVALVHDAHTALNPLYAPAAHVHYYGIELYRFDDGVFVRKAAPPYAALAGTRVLRIGRVSIDSALAAAARVISHENDWWAGTWAPLWLTFAEVLDGLGLVDDKESLPLVIERAAGGGGRRDSVVLKPVALLVPAGHNPAGPIDRGSWTDMRGAGTTPLWLRNPSRSYWVEYQPGDRTLYVCYRAVVSLPEPTGNEAFWRQVFALTDSLPIARMVLDIRENSGGNSFYNRQVVRGIVARPKLDRPDRLFVIIGPRTFSAAMNLARDLEQWTSATFVGEPTGNALYFFGDHNQLVLPASGLNVAVSSLTWPPYDPHDRRDFLGPALYTPLTAAAYRENRDPALRAILERGSTVSITDRVEQAVRRGDTLSAVRAVDAARRDVANRFHTPETDVNALGYQLLRAGETDLAILVFRVNTQTFPQSANAWDSLGEALVAAGRRDAGIAAYRRAVAIDSTFVSSQQALQRLGAAPHQP